MVSLQKDHTTGKGDARVRIHARQDDDQLVVVLVEAMVNLDLVRVALDSRGSSGSSGDSARSVFRKS